MITDTDHEVSDWRAGLSWKEVTDMTRSGPRNEEFKTWRLKMEEKIKILRGRDGPGGRCHRGGEGDVPEVDLRVQGSGI